MWSVRLLALILKRGWRRGHEGSWWKKNGREQAYICWMHTTERNEGSDSKGNFIRANPVISVQQETYTPNNSIINNFDSPSNYVIGTLACTV